MLVEPERTRYDWTFRLFRFPVRVHPLFWLGAALLGASILDQRNGLLYLLLWIAVVFASILVHELGHALAFRWFGTDSHIVLYIFGGLAVPWAHVNGRWRRIVVSLAGPFAGFLLCALVWGSDELYPWAGQSRPLSNTYRWLFWVNLVWNLFNLLPVFPLDGGQVSQEVCGAVWRQNGLRVSLRVSVAVAAAVALFSVASYVDRDGTLLGWLPGWFPRPGLWTAILFAILAVQSYQLLQQVAQSTYYYEDSDDRPPWRR